MMNRQWRLGLVCMTLAVLVSGFAWATEDGDAPVPEKRIKMYAENWKFTPSTIRIPQGHKLILDFVSRDSSHSFEMKGYRVKFPLPEGSKKTLEIVMDKAGTFKFKCGRPCGNGCPKMRGKIIVEPAAEVAEEEGSEPAS